MRESIRPYHYSVSWIELLEPWMRSPYPEIRLQCKFVFGHLSSACAGISGNSSCLELDEKDMLLLFSLLSSAVHSPELMIQQFEWEFSALELVIAFQSISLNHKNLARIPCSEMTSLLSELIQKADTTGKLEVCKLLWALMDFSMSYLVEGSSILDLVKELESHGDANLKIVSISLGIASTLRSKSYMEIGELVVSCIHSTACTSMFRI